MTDLLESPPADVTDHERAASEARSAERIPVRRISFGYPAEDMPRHFMADEDLVMSHIVAVLSSLFPEGEDYFVRSVRNYRDRIEDPVLKKQVAAFIGQEAIHGREHRDLNALLQELGYPTKRIDWYVQKLLGLDEKVFPPSWRLAVTAALEHYTATLAEVLMGSEAARAEFGVDEVRSLLLWHALEESEHKAVAFDVYQQVCGDPKLRARIMNLVTFGFLTSSVGWTIVSLARDPASRDLKRLRSSVRRLRFSPWLTKDVRRRIRDYNRPDFHPDDHDATELLAQWRERLFGDDGTLVANLATR